MFAMGWHETLARRVPRCATHACLAALLAAAPAIAQPPPAGSLTLQAAMERAVAANPTIAAARLGRAIDVAGLALAGERLNPEASVEIEKETPKQSFGFAVPLELGGKRAKRIAVGRGDDARRRGGAGGDHRAGPQRRPSRLLRGAGRRRQVCGPATSCATCRSAPATRHRRASTAAMRRGWKCCRPISPSPPRRTRRPRQTAPCSPPESKLNAAARRCHSIRVRPLSDARSMTAAPS